MARVTSIIFALLLIFGHQQSCKSQGDSKLDKLTTYIGYAGVTIGIGKDLYTGIQEIYNHLLPKSVKESESDVKLDPGMEQHLTDHIKYVSKKLDFLKIDIQNVKDEIIDRISNDILEHEDLKSNLHQIYSNMQIIEIQYEYFFNFIKGDPTNINNITLYNFATSVTSASLSELRSVLNTIYWMLIATDTNTKSSVLNVLSRSSQAPTQMCKTKPSFQQMIYNLYEAIRLTDVKAYAMIQYGYQILKYLEGGDWSREMNTAEKEFNGRITNITEAVIKAMRTASRELWTCDTYAHKEEVTYTKLNNVFQKYFIYEGDLSKDNTCVNDCGYYNQSKAYGCFDKLCTQQRTCSGNLWGCENKIAYTMHICPADKGSSRRYKYVDYDDGKRYGPKETCPTRALETVGWGRGFMYCSYCLCTCDDLEYANSDRYFNLRTVKSRHNYNYVVTGARFIKSNNIIHIQIQEGQLLPGGKINEKTVSWYPIMDYKIGEVFPESKGKYWEFIPEEGRDYHKLEWKHLRQHFRDDKFMYRKSAINLDDVDFANPEYGNYSDYVVAGLRFAQTEVNGSGEHLNLEVLLVPFNFTTGEILTQHISSIWHKVFTMSKIKGMLLMHKSEKSEVKLDKLDIPTNSGVRAYPNSHTNQYLYFTTSDLEKDAGQNTIPFIDLQPVETNPPMPLSGAGLFHKSSPGSGGFLSLKLFTYDYTAKLQEIGRKYIT